MFTDISFPANRMILWYNCRPTTAGFDISHTVEYGLDSFLRLHLATAMLSLLCLHLPINLNWSKIFLSKMIKYLQELIQRMDQFKPLFLYRVYLQKLKLMIFFQQLKARLFSLGNAIHKIKTVGQSFWKNSGQELMLIMKEQLLGGSMRLSHSLLDYLRRIIFLLNIMPIRLGLSLSNILKMDIFQDVEQSEMAIILNLIQME